MTRVVRGADGRMWTLRSQVEWSSPATADDFEHEFSAGYVPGIAMIVLVVAFIVVLFVWSPADVVIPWWLVLLLIALLLFFPVRWALHRPWKLVAETGEENPGEPAEKWVGTVRGVFHARQETAKIAKSIETDALPTFEGPLHPVE
ncbi:DUF983 domain-containing protein [Labedaea rhizosphaerae]|uniref:DUF983 domain-containing protein n=1 Tax=Labedaea rhizosphaerae TaxID=598644 RepID=A0A4R6SMH8_LABRH|nr:DUF983 domain-containing protein [Labedaea rhizosphaerae]TDQ05091.1 hypothetical protein EV186_1011055 [Labedaea rhizosphaerae]